MVDSTAKLLQAGGAAEVWLPWDTTLYIIARGNGTVYCAFPSKGPPYTGGSYPYVPESALWWDVPVSVASQKFDEAQQAENAFLRGMSHSR